MDARNSGSSPERQREPREVVGSRGSLKQGETKEGRKEGRSEDIERSFSGRGPPLSSDRERSDEHPLIERYRGGDDASGNNTCAT